MNYHKINNICNKLFRPRYEYHEKFNSVKYVTGLYLTYYNNKEPESIEEITNFLNEKFIDITLKFILNNKNSFIIKKRLNMIILYLDYPELYYIRNMYLDYRDYYINYDNCNIYENMI